MKKFGPSIGVFAIALAVVVFVASCSSDDDSPTQVKTYPANAMVSQAVSTPPAGNATIDGLWAGVPALDISTVVPAYDFDVDGKDIWWDNYEGEQINVKFKSVYTSTHVYFLIQWNDPEESLLRQAWYYHPTGQKWLQMGKKYPDEFGNDPAYEDKFTVFWNMTVGDFMDAGCTPLCHGQYMGTNGAGDKMDIWHWKRDRTGPVSQLDDKWLNNAQNGRNADAGTGAYASNKQSLVTSAGPTISAPMYWIPGRDNYHWIMQTEIDNRSARLIVDLNAAGNLVDEDGTELDKTLFGYKAPKCIPSLIKIKPATGSRGDVSAWHNWSNGMWTLKIKRLRNTGNGDDLQFTKTETSYWFSVGVMNGAAIAHATPGGWNATAYRLILAE